MSSGSADNRLLEYFRRQHAAWDIHNPQHREFLSGLEHVENFLLLLDRPGYFLANEETRAFIRTQLALRILAESIEEQS